MKINYKTSRNTIKKIVDENTIKKITTAKLLDLPFKKLNPEEDKKWNARKINAELLQAIEQGEDIKTMSERFLKIKDMNEVSAMRNARTMTTSFENLGRLDGMKKMKENGTILKKKWLATNDSKTRDAHAQLNGTVAEVDEPFRNDLGEIMYPGDPSASAANIYNCRCTLTYEIEGFEPTLAKGTIKKVRTDDKLYYSYEIDKKVDELNARIKLTNKVGVLAPKKSKKAFELVKGYKLDLKEKETAGKLKLPKEAKYSSLGVDWHIPGKKRPIYRSTKSTSDEIFLMVKANPKATIKELYEGTTSFNTESWKVLKAYINKGYGDVIASKWFKYK